MGVVVVVVQTPAFVGVAMDFVTPDLWRETRSASLASRCQFHTHDCSKKLDRFQLIIWYGIIVNSLAFWGIEVMIKFCWWNWPQECASECRRLRGAVTSGRARAQARTSQTGLCSSFSFKSNSRTNNCILSPLSGRGLVTSSDGQMTSLGGQEGIVGDSEWDLFEVVNAAGSEDVTGSQGQVSSVCVGHSTASTTTTTTTTTTTIRTTTTSYGESKEETGLLLSTTVRVRWHLLHSSKF